MPPQDAQISPTRVRRRVVLSLIVIAVLLALVFTPPLVNVDRYRHRIVQTMSDSLGRPVHIDDVRLHLLPFPSLELRNVVVSEDPAFGSEPTIRANRVEAILRPSSLWRRRIEFSTIRFTADDNGSGPSVNLVRNAAGRWNLDSVLMQAAHVSTAPTDQPKAGPAPRFPYIEATAARVNLKLGNEKMPFSLTDAEFALWLPSPHQWHVRLNGRPIRTDANLNETGLARLEGTLDRAPSMAQVPVDLQATWTGAQLGGGTELLTGQDMGWRGTATLHAALRGPLGDAQFTSTLDLSGLRRTDFIPAHSLDLILTCQAHATVTEATLENAACSLPAPLPEQQGPGRVQVQATHVDLTSRTATDLGFGIHASDAWLLDWARLLTPGIPPDEAPRGAVEGAFTHISASPKQPAFWTGNLQGAVTGLLPWQKATETPATYDFMLTGSPSGLDLAPFNLAPASESPLALSGTGDRTGYTLHLTGSAIPQHVLALAAKLPPFATGVDTALLGTLPHASPTPALPQRIDLTCTRAWTTPEQTCTAGHPAEPPTRSRAGTKSRPRR